MKTTKVSDVMTRTVVAAREDTPFKEIARLMAEYRVSGLPVLNPVDQLIGIVSESDLLRNEEWGGPKSFLLDWFIGKKRLEEIESRRENVVAGDVMTRHVVTIGPDATVHEAARTILENGVKRLPVVDEDKRVLGIVSRQDLIRPYLRPDETIRREITEDLILETMWIDPQTISVSVKRGIVTLEGKVETKGTKEVLVQLVRRVDGVIGLEDHLAFVADDRGTNTRPPELTGFGFGRGSLTSSSPG